MFPLLFLSNKCSFQNIKKMYLYNCEEERTIKKRKKKERKKERKKNIKVFGLSEVPAYDATFCNSSSNMRL